MCVLSICDVQVPDMWKRTKTKKNRQNQARDWKGCQKVKAKKVKVKAAKVKVNSQLKPKTEPDSKRPTWAQLNWSGQPKKRNKPKAYLKVHLIKKLVHFLLSKYIKKSKSKYVAQQHSLAQLPFHHLNATKQNTQVNLTVSLRD